MIRIALKKTSFSDDTSKLIKPGSWALLKTLFLELAYHILPLSNISMRLLYIDLLLKVIIQESVLHIP